MLSKNQKQAPNFQQVDVLLTKNYPQFSYFSWIPNNFMMKIYFVQNVLEDR